MQYLFASITINPYSEMAADCLSSFLGEINFDTFEPTEDGIKAYIPKNLFDEEALQSVLNDFFLPVSLAYTVEELENKDYNEQWEKENFDPILEREFGIKLDPRMAFGSGSHETTHQLVSLLMQMDFSGQTVLDMGCGTGVLGIAMAKSGAEKVTAIDIDDMSVENTKLNFSLNFGESLSSDDDSSEQTSSVSPKLTAITGDADAIEGMFDTIVANIFKSILLRDMPIYLQHLVQGGRIIFSGFYTSDAPDMINAAQGYGLTLKQQMSDNDWCVLVFSKG